MTASMEGTRDRICKALKAQTQTTITPLSSLLAVFDELGYISEEAIEEVSAFTNSTVNDVWGVASFYTNFRFTPPGDHTIDICWGPTCHVKGAMSIIDTIVVGLGLAGEGDTPDGRISVRFNTCLGACSQGPVISIDHKLVGKITPSMAKELLELQGDSGNG